MNSQQDFSAMFILKNKIPTENLTMEAHSCAIFISNFPAPSDLTS